jgi:hypothetical protein
MRRGFNVLHWKPFNPACQRLPAPAAPASACVDFWEKFSLATSKKKFFSGRTTCLPPLAGMGLPHVPFQLAKFDVDATCNVLQCRIRNATRREFRDHSHILDPLRTKLTPKKLTPSPAPHIKLTRNWLL